MKSDRGVKNEEEGTTSSKGKDSRLNLRSSNNPFDQYQPNGNKNTEILAVGKHRNHSGEHQTK
jgi:hypothetical protein